MKTCTFIFSLIQVLYFIIVFNQKNKNLNVKRQITNYLPGQDLQNYKKEPRMALFINGGLEVTKFELIINKFIEKIRTFEMFELGRMIDFIVFKRKIA